jgi:hypothetical protein
MITVYAEHLRELAAPSPVGDYIKVAIGRAARRAGLDYWRAFDIWYGKARRIDAHEAERIADALQKKREEETRNDLHDLRTRLLKMESRIAAEAANRASPSLSHLRPRLR